MQIKLLIVSLGGNGSVARRCGVTSAAVSNWIGQNAIPREHHLAIWQMALDAGLDWTPPEAEAIRARLCAQCLAPAATP